MEVLRREGAIECAGRQQPPWEHVDDEPARPFRWLDETGEEIPNPELDMSTIEGRNVFAGGPTTAELVDAWIAHSAGRAPKKKPTSRRSPRHAHRRETS